MKGGHPDEGDAPQVRGMGFDHIGSRCDPVDVRVRGMVKALRKISDEEREWRATGDKPGSGYELHRMGEE